LLARLHQGRRVLELGLQLHAENEEAVSASLLARGHDYGSDAGSGGRHRPQHDPRCVAHHVAEEMQHGCRKHAGNTMRCELFKRRGV
jgi:hypothetical protein